MLAGFMSVTPPAHAGSSQDVRTVARVDLSRYAGEWFEVARFPNRFQEKCAGDVQARYARRSDGRIDVINRCRRADGSIDEARGVARVVDEQTSAKLKVRFAPAVLSFLPMVWGDYWVIGLAEDYAWAVVGSPDREYLWVLGRRQELTKGELAAALATARANGFDVDRLRMTAQTPSSREARNASHE
ncbi:MAG: lipocalin family protein [Acidobacteria bacterium]|nr:lipocalin family protein [Acidobacteriota bacterium]